MGKITDSLRMATGLSKDVKNGLKSIEMDNKPRLLLILHGICLFGVDLKVFRVKISTRKNEKQI